MHQAGADLADVESREHGTVGAVEALVSEAADLLLGEIAPHSDAPQLPEGAVGAVMGSAEEKVEHVEAVAGNLWVEGIHELMGGFVRKAGLHLLVGV